MNILMYQQKKYFMDYNKDILDIMDMYIYIYNGDVPSSHQTIAGWKIHGNPGTKWGIVQEGIVHCQV